MKLDYVSNPTLLTRIKRSYSHISDEHLRTQKAVSTNLFVFEKLDCSKIKLEFTYLWNSCLKVTVTATGEQFVTTRRFSFGDDVWSLYRPREQDQIHICTNEDCLKNFGESDCKALLYCSIECCKQQFIKEEGSLDDFSGCERCLA